MKRELTCIICPVGCSLQIELEGKEVRAVSGNSCPRGAKYAAEECVHPKRTVTSTVRCTNGAVLPVKTSVPIPKEKVTECMERINQTVVQLPKRAGDVIIKDIFGSDLIATADMPSPEA